MRATGLSADPEVVEFEYEDHSLVVEFPVNDHIGRTIAETGGFYEGVFLEHLRRIIPSGCMVVDVGANVGNHSLFLAKICECRVVAYEPVKYISDVLRRNIQRNFCDGMIELRSLALGATEGSARLAKMDKSNLGGAQLVTDTNGEIVVSTLDNEWFEERVEFVKIDAEGMDIEVLRGARELLERDRPLVSFEAATNEGFRELRELIETLDYALLGVYNATPTYLYGPARGAEELTAHLQRLGHINSLRDAELAGLHAQSARNSRYTRRIMDEHLNTYEHNLL